MDVIGFDLDGVLYPWHKSVLNELQIFHGVTQEYEEFWGEKWQEFPESFWVEFVKIEHLYGNMFIDPEALETLEYFNDEGYPIWYITNRPREVEFATWSWMKRNNLPQRENLIFTPDKTVVVKEKNIAYYVEDRVSNAQALKDITNVILFRQPYNKEIRDEFTCINSIKELKELIK